MSRLKLNSVEREAIRQAADVCVGYINYGSCNALSDALWWLEISDYRRQQILKAYRRMFRFRNDRYAPFTTAEWLHQGQIRANCLRIFGLVYS